MANRIISFQSSELQQRLQDNPYEVFLDLSKVSKTTGTSNEFKLLRLVNVNAIRNSLANIFSWTPGERVLLPEFGSKLRNLLYEGITDSNVESIIAEIKHSVSTWESRVSITNIYDASTDDDHENNTIHLKIVYIIKELSDEQFEYDYVLSINSY